MVDADGLMMEGLFSMKGKHPRPYMENENVAQKHPFAKLSPCHEHATTPGNVENHSSVLDGQGDHGTEDRETTQIEWARPHDENATSQMAG